jgi:tRNA(fMet)-specific endonuclease VapC
VKIAVDTNRCTDLIAGDPEVVQNLESAPVIYLPFICAGELRAGFLGGSRGTENERALAKFLAREGVSILFADDQTTHHYARLKVQLRRQGTPIPTNDVWIAALVLQHGLTLYTRDQHFSHLRQIPRL